MDSGWFDCRTTRRITRHSLDPRGPSTSNEDGSMGDDCHRPLSICYQSRQLARPVCAALVGKVASPHQNVHRTWLLVFATPPAKSILMMPTWARGARKAVGLIAHP
jgi:hypothetical protein